MSTNHTKRHEIQAHQKFELSPLSEKKRKPMLSLIPGPYVFALFHSAESEDRNGEQDLHHGYLSPSLIHTVVDIFFSSGYLL